MKSRAPLCLGALTLAAGAALQAAGGCAPSGPRSPVAVLATPARTTTVAPTPPSAAPSPRSPLVQARRPLGAPPLESLPVELLPVSGGKTVLAISQVAGERVAWARRIDGASGAQGALWRFVDEHVVGAFDTDRGTAIATSNGTHVCIARFAYGADAPAQRGCAEVAPVAIAALGDRLALLELEVLPPPSPRRKSLIDVGVRWASFDGAIDTAVTPIGLRFERPLEGMHLIDVAERAGSLDLLWYEAAPARGRSRYGSARFGAATLRADGTLDPTSRVALPAGTLEPGAIAGRRAPSLVAGAESTVLLTRSARSGPCEATRILPKLGRAATSPAGCAIDPYALAVQGEASATLDRILAAEPRRAPGQARADVPLVTWAGDRAFFTSGGALRSGDRAGELRAEAAPLAARRARVAWSAFARDGEGLAYAAGQLYRVDAAGALTALPAAATATATRLRASDPAGAERRRAARIADTWWVARGDVFRVAGEPLVARQLAGRALPDATALVGGDTRGLFLEVVGGELRVSGLLPSGALVPLPAAARAPSPVRVGFVAVERLGGGAIVAGAGAAATETAVRALVVDAEGSLGAPQPTSLPASPGLASVHLTALPGGGALLTDAARQRVVWLDDDAREIAAAPWPLEDSGAICVDGWPARALVPSATPGRLARVRDLASEGACISGEPAWAADGTLRWFGSTARGLDATAEAGVLAVAGEAPQPPRAPAEKQAARFVVAAAAPAVTPVASPTCPADMVSIAGRFCIDRFEGTLVDATTGEPLAPDYPATPSFLEMSLADWATGRSKWGTVHARAFPLPTLPAWQRGATPAPLAVSRFGVRPNGYVRGLVAEGACAAAGKRLCDKDEFRTACRGEDDTAFPYGDAYVAGTCNVHRDDHPAAILHGNASLGHLDARLNRVSGADGPLFHATGARPACRSRWGSDAAYDLVGNLDEWVHAPKGAFAGGFYSRATRLGCDALITGHPKEYLDYSTGIRCCKSLR